MLAGGRGERFWPWSTPERPKQLLPLAAAGRTLLDATVERATSLVPPRAILVLTAADLVEAVRAECPHVEVMGEPVGRNTAPAIAAAATYFGPDSSFAVMPSDHFIGHLERFRSDLERAFVIAESRRVLVTLGIKPTGPETNFGYIRRGGMIEEGFYRVSEFCEKPDRKKAEAYVQDGNYFWNSGIFVWRSDVFLEALAETKPTMVQSLQGVGQHSTARSFERGLADVFPRLEAISVDYAVMEKAGNAVMLEASFDWDDMGSWNAWARRQPLQPGGNVIQGDVIPIDTTGSILINQGDGPIGVVGLKEMIVVRGTHGTLVCPRSASDRVRAVTEQVRDRESN